MSKKQNAVKAWRHRTKLRMVESMGGSCAVCGYNKCVEALELHHIDPLEKEFGFGKIMSNPIAWYRIVEEIRKCVLLCSNHHREIHSGIISLPGKHATFNEDFLQYKNYSDLNGKCFICGKETSSSNITCSKECAAKRSRTVEWDKIDLKAMLESNMTLSQIADKFNISPSAVSKRIRKFSPELSNMINRTWARNNVFCSICKTKITSDSKSGLCSVCYNFSKRKVERPTKEQLEEEIKNSSWLALGKKYGVSDNAIRKWAKSYDII